jgi:hypothetical protein
MVYVAGVWGFVVGDRRPSGATPDFPRRRVQNHVSRPDTSARVSPMVKQGGARTQAVTPSRLGLGRRDPRSVVVELRSRVLGDVVVVSSHCGRRCRSDRCCS